MLGHHHGCGVAGDECSHGPSYEKAQLYFSAVKKGTVYLRIESTLPLDRSQPRDYVYALNLTID